MVLSDGVSGATEGNDREGVQKPPTRRLKCSLSDIRDFTLRIQCEVLEVLGILDDTNLSIRFLQEYGGAIRHTIETFEKKENKKPTVYDLLWCLGADCHLDPQEEVVKWRKAA